MGLVSKTSASAAVTHTNLHNTWAVKRTYESKGNNKSDDGFMHERFRPFMLMLYSSYNSLEVSRKRSVSSTFFDKSARLPACYMLYHLAGYVHISTPIDTLKKHHFPPSFVLEDQHDGSKMKNMNLIGRISI